MVVIINSHKRLFGVNSRRPTQFELQSKTKAILLQLNSLLFLLQRLYCAKYVRILIMKLVQHWKLTYSAQILIGYGIITLYCGFKYFTEIHCWKCL